jgi:hypothetical protein
VPEISKAGAGNQAHIACSDHRDAHLKPLSAKSLPTRSRIGKDLQGSRPRTQPLTSATPTRISALHLILFHRDTFLHLTIDRGVRVVSLQATVHGRAGRLLFDSRWQGQFLRDAPEKSSTNLNYPARRSRTARDLVNLGIRAPRHCYSQFT